MSGSQCLDPSPIKSSCLQTMMVPKQHAAHLFPKILAQNNILVEFTINLKVQKVLFREMGSITSSWPIITAGGAQPSGPSAEQAFAA